MLWSVTLIQENVAEIEWNCLDSNIPNISCCVTKLKKMACVSGNTLI